MRKGLPGALVCWFVAAAVVASMFWSCKHVVRHKRRFKGGSRNQSLAQLARSTKKFGVRQRLAIYYLAAEKIPGARLAVPRSMLREAGVMASVARVKVTLDNDLALPVEVYQKLRPTANYERTWIRRTTLFVLEKGQQDYVLAAVPDSSLILLPRTKYQALRAGL